MISNKLNRSLKQILFKRKTLLLLFLSLCCLSSSAYDFETDGIYYSIIDSREVQITSENPDDVSSVGSYEGNIVIPEVVKYGGVSYSVTSIGSYAFYGCHGLTSIKIPNSVISIESSAFSQCNGLTSVIIPNSVTSIGKFAFYGCSGLASVAIPNSVTVIGSSAFCNCSGLASITIPGSVSSIRDAVFMGCSGLTAISIPNSVSSIGSNAFSECSGLTAVTIPGSVSSIGDGAFSRCSGLSSISIPNSVTVIGNSAFSECRGLSSVTIPESVFSMGQGTFLNCSGLTSIKIPNSVKSIGDYAFYGCSGLSSVTIPNSVTSIGNYAFSGCKGLTAVTIPNSVNAIGNDAFAKCDNLKDIISCNASAPKLNTNVFSLGLSVYVPTGSKASYEKEWSSYNCNFYEIDETNVPVDFSSSQYAAVMLPFDCYLPENVHAYSVTGNDDDVLNLSDMGGVMYAYKSYLLKSDKEKSIVFSGYGIVKDKGWFEDGSKMAGCVSEKETQDGDYVLQNKDGNVGFYRMSAGVKVPPFQAVLYAMEGDVPVFVLDKASAIENVTASTPSTIDVCSISGVKICSVKSEDFSVEDLPKGIYIIDGKKVFVK